MKYKVHRFEMRMSADQDRLERFLNDLKGEVVAIIPNITMKAVWVHEVNFVLIIEKLP
jgi:hypothetical protein